jgi:hypothetical protein
LLTEEGDEEYDEECLFDWSLLEKAQADAAAAAECTPEFLKRLSDAGFSDGFTDSDEEDDDDDVCHGWEIFNW